MLITQSMEGIQAAFTGLWFTVGQYLPRLLMAVVVFIVGWIFAVILFRIVVEVVKVLRVD